MKEEAMQELILAFGVLIMGLGLFMVAQNATPDLFNKLTGYVTEQTVQTQVNVVGILPLDCNTTFVAGWNLISLFCINNGQSISTALAPISGEYTAIFSYAPQADDEWKSYNPSLPAWAVQDLSALTRNDGYWLYVPADTLYYYNGTKRAQSTITFVPGWNLVGYPTNTSRNITLALQGSTGNVTLVRAYNASIPSLIYYPEGTLHDFTSYYGYWVYVNSSGTWFINW